MNHASLNLLHNLVTDVSQMLEHHPRELVIQCHCLLNKMN